MNNMERTEVNRDHMGRPTDQGFADKISTNMTTQTIEAKTRILQNQWHVEPTQVLKTIHSQEGNK